MNIRCRMHPAKGVVFSLGRGVRVLDCDYIVPDSAAKEL